MVALAPHRAPLRAILAVRLERGSRDDIDRALMTVVQAREREERAGWFN